MKANSLCGPARLRIVGAAVLAAWGLCTHPVAAQNSPVGTWDMLISGGGQQGLAIVTFSSVGGTNSFSGYELLCTKAKPSTDPREAEASRNGGGDASRFIGADTSTNALGGNTNVFGFGPVNGPWQFDDKGRVVGFFSELVGATSFVTNWSQCVEGVLATTNVILDGTMYTFQAIFNLGCFTNQSPTTNVSYTFTSPTNYTATFQFTSTNPPVIVPVSSAQTNAVSFVAKVVPGKRITLTASTTFGKITYRGVPARTLQDLTGPWIGDKRVNKQDVLEFFTLASTTVTNPFSTIEGFADLTNFPNIYTTMDGAGPGFAFRGFSMLSSQKKIGFSFKSDYGGTAGSALSATFGGFNGSSKPPKGTTKGIEAPDLDINFKAIKQPVP